MDDFIFIYLYSKWLNLNNKVSERFWRLVIKRGNSEFFKYFKFDNKEDRAFYSEEDGICLIRDETSANGQDLKGYIKNIKILLT